MADTRARRVAILLSAFVYPGAGQLYQKRWLRAFMFIVLFTVFFTGLLVAVLGPLIRSYIAALSWAEGKQDFVAQAPSTTRILFNLTACFLIYLSNVVDVFRLGKTSPRSPQTK